LKHTYDTEGEGAVIIAWFIWFMVKDHFDIHLEYPLLLVSYLAVGILTYGAIHWLNRRFN